MLRTPLTLRERAILGALRKALWEIEQELLAAGEDEVRHHPILLGKRHFVDRTKARIRRWEGK